MKARARFCNRQIDTCEVQVEGGEVRVWDPIAGAFTRCHSLNRQWALDHVHHSDRRNWLRVARRAFDRRDGAKLGIMVLGS